MKFLFAVSRAIDALNERVGRVACWLTFLVVLIAVGNALMRYLFRIGSNAFLEAQWYMFSGIFLFGAAYTLLKGGHVRVDVFYGRCQPRTRAWIDILGTLFFLLPMAIGIAVLAWPMVSSSIAVWEQSSDYGGLPRWPLKLAIPVAFGLLALQGVSELIKRVAFLRGAGPPPVQRRELQ